MDEFVNPRTIAIRWIHELLLSNECDCICLGLYVIHHTWKILLQLPRLLFCSHLLCCLEYSIFYVGCWLLYRLIECMQYIVIMEWQTRVPSVVHLNLNNNDLATSHSHSFSAKDVSLKKLIDLECAFQAYIVILFRINAMFSVFAAHSLDFPWQTHKIPFWACLLGMNNKLTICGLILVCFLELKFNFKPKCMARPQEMNWKRFGFCCTFIYWVIQVWKGLF